MARFLVNEQKQKPSKKQKTQQHTTTTIQEEKDTNYFKILGLSFFTIWFFLIEFFSKNPPQATNDNKLTYKGNPPQVTNDDNKLTYKDVTKHFKNKGRILKRVELATRETEDSTDTSNLTYKDVTKHFRPGSLRRINQ